MLRRVGCSYARVLPGQLSRYLAAIRLFPGEGMARLEL